MASQVFVIERGSPDGFVPYGGNARAYKSRKREVVVSGGVNTGKSYSNLEKAYEYAYLYPGSQILLLRKTFTALIASAVKTWEKVVLPYPPGHSKCPVTKHVTRDRTYYVFKHNGSEVVLGGLNKRSDALSSEYDMIVVVQCEELTEGEWVYLLTRVGRGAGKNGPYAQVLGDANPHPLGKKHWIPRRAKVSLELLYTTRKDNPALWDREKNRWTEEGQEYEDMFATFPEDERKRLGEGLWEGAGNLVYDEFKDEYHLITWDEVVEQNVQFEKFYMGVDWGWTDPCSLSLYGLSFEPCLYQIRTTYRVQEHPDFWTRRAMAYSRWVRRFFEKSITMVYADPAYPAYIDQFRNSGLRVQKGHDGPRSLMQGIGHVKQWLADGKIKIVVGNIDGNKMVGELGADPRLLAKYKPTCLWDEIKLYQNPDPETIKGDVMEVKPIEGNDHSLAEFRYTVSRIQQSLAKPKIESRSMSAEEFLEKMGISDSLYQQGDFW